MMNTRYGILLSILCFALTAGGYSSIADELLTPADIKKITGIEGIKTVPRNPALGAGGDLNFALEDNTMILIAAIQNASMYGTWKSQEGFFHTEISGIGDEAFEGPDFGDYRYMLIFRKGKRAVSLSSFFNMSAGGTPYMNQKQLRELAKIIISRL